MKSLLLAALVLSSGVASANSDAFQVLMNAITVCPKDQNPLTQLQAMGGNSFADVKFEAETQVVTAMGIHDPQLLNPLIMRPSRIMGNVRVEMQYPAPGYGLVCSVSVIN